jgi:hypothetical protein
MPMNLVFTRSKSFVDSSEGTKKFLAQANPGAAIAVPFWVAMTDTFKYGIKDGSIVNLTPPHLMPGYKTPKPAPETLEEMEDEAETSEPVLVEEAEQTQTEAPKAPFGAQPMTPVPPAPRVGGITASTKRTR